MEKAGPGHVFERVKTCHPVLGLESLKMASNEFSTMSKLRSGKKLEQQSVMSAKSLAKMSELVKGLAEKIDSLEAFSQSRHDAIYAKLTTLESTTNGLSAGLEVLNQEMEIVKQSVERKADQAQLELLERRDGKSLQEE